MNEPTRIIPHNESTLIDLSTAATRLGVTERTLQHWTKKYRLPVIKIARTIRYDWALLERTIKDKFTLR